MASSDQAPPVVDVHDKFVFLRDGPVVPAAAYVLLLRLEARGFRVTAEAPDRLRVQPPDQLTADDCTAIRRWKWHLLMLIAYCQRDDVAAHLFDTRA